MKPLPNRPQFKRQKPIDPRIRTLRPILHAHVADEDRVGFGYVRDEDTEDGQDYPVRD